MKHILVVDDVALNLKRAEAVLNGKYYVSVAHSGKEAVEMLKNEVPDLILLDVIMPEMDGYETFGKIRELPGLQNVPIIFLTADTGVGSEIMGLQMGAMDYIHKPFDPSVMLSRVKRVLENEEMKKRLELNAKQDTLTGLWNRIHLQEIVNYTGEQEGTGFFILLDMDNFKGVNDNFGHLIGDAVLARFAEALKTKMKVGDIACRIGGDEFAVFVNTTMTKTEFARVMDEWLIELTAAVREIKGEETQITISAGVSMMPSDGSDFVSLYNRADKALYHVKRNGKRTYHFYQDKEMLVFESLSNQVDIEQIQSLMADKHAYAGVFQLEYEGFSQIYQFIQRSVERSNQKVQMVLFTVRAREDMGQDHESTGKLIRLMEDTIVYSLRKNDVANRYNNSQYVVLLLDADIKDGDKVAERILEKCQRQFLECGYEIIYDIQTIKKRTEE